MRAPAQKVQCSARLEVDSCSPEVRAGVERAGDGAQEGDAPALITSERTSDPPPKHTGRLVRPYLRWGNPMIALEQ